MKNIIVYGMLLVAMFTLSGCSSGPDKDVLKALVLTAATSRSPQGFEFGKFEILNDYKKEIQNETAYIYEIKMTIKKTDGSLIDGQNKETPPVKYKITLAKEGKEWRYLLGSGITGPMPN